MLHNSLS